MRKLLFFLLGFYAALGQTDSTVICLPCNQINEDQAFLQLKNSIGSRPFRIVHIGDSHIQIGHFSKEIRAILAEHAELNGSGISFPYSMAKSVDGPWFKAKFTGTWIGDKLLSPKPQLDLGLTGYSVKTTDSSATIAFQLRESVPNFDGINVWFQVDSLSYFPDLGDNFTLKELVGSNNQIGFAHFVAKNPFRQFDLKLLKKDSIARKFQLHGIELVNSQGSLAYHALGVAGAQFSHLIFRTPHWKEQLKLLNPDLLIFSYGTNEAYNSNFDAPTFVKQVGRFFEEIKSVLPQVAILMTSPPDTRSRNRIPPKQVEVIQGLSQIKSSFYDLNKVMGGFGSYQAWIEHNYFLKDKLHLNKAGYELQADLFMLALLGQLQPNWDLSNLKTRVEAQANTLVRKIVGDSLNKDTLISPPVEILYHRVKKGESFFSIAKRYKQTIDALVRRNKRLKIKTLQVGDRIRIN